MNICVIGLGSMGKRRIRLLRDYYADMLITGVESNLERAKDVADKYHIKVYSSLNDMEEKQDCAFVCTSPQFHAGIIKECLERDMHVFTEINLISDFYDENMKAAGERGKVLFLSSTPLYRAEIQIIDQKVKQSGTKCIYQYHVGQYLPDWHPWDNLNDFFISSKLTNGCRELLAIELPWIQNTFGKIEQVHVIKRKITSLRIDFPDTYLIQIEHANGNIGSLVVDVVSRQAVRRLEVFNEDLYMKWNGTPDTLYEKNLISNELKKIQAGQYLHEEKYGDFINEYAYAKEIEGFFDVIGGRKPLYDFEKDKEILRIIDEIEK